MRFREMKLARDPDCPGCGPNRRAVGEIAPACAASP
jgi:hypothetical protein